MPIVAGVVAIAVAIEEAVAHPDTPLHGEVTAALVVGTTLYLSGMAYGIRRTRTVSPVTWIVTALVAAGVIVFTQGRPPALPPLVTAVILLLLIAVAPKPRAQTAR